MANKVTFVGGDDRPSRTLPGSALTESLQQHYMS